MKEILFDANVLLDILLERNPHRRASEAVFAAAERKTCEGWIAAHAVTTIECLLRKQLTGSAARAAVSQILRVLKVAPVDGSVLHEAVRLSFSDFEDAVTAASAQAAGCDFIVTRDLKGFRNSPVRALPPEAVLALLA